MTHARQRLGTRGESLAASWYEDRGYRVVARNWRAGRGELDLVLRRGRTLVFAEVKTRSTWTFGSPALAVGLAKQEQLRSLALRFLEQHPQRASELRFDVVCVVDDEVVVLEAAF